MAEVGRAPHYGPAGRAAAEAGAIGSGSVLVCCDLRGVALAGRDLRGARLLGCRLSGVSLAGADVDALQLVGCFASAAQAPLAVGDADVEAITVVDGHLDTAPAGVLGAGWPDALVAAVLGTMAERNDERYRAVGALRELGDARTAPVLACALADEEWEVRSAALGALVALRGDAFPEADRELLSWMLLALGDTSAFVADRAEQLLRALAPGDAPLEAALHLLDATEVEPLLLGLRAARAAARAGELADRLDSARVVAACRHESAAVRAEAMALLAQLDRPELAPDLLAGLSDPATDVRLAALSAVLETSAPPAGARLAHLLRDDDPEVRAQALYALAALDALTEDERVRAARDPSESVRRAAESVAPD